MIEIYLSENKMPEGVKKYEWEHQLGRKLLILGLKELYGIEEHKLADLQFTTGIHGKPCLKDFPQIHYNISHTDGMVICGFSDREIGVDVERMRPYGDGILRKVLSESENRYISELPQKEREENFFKIWTLKESYGKAVGCGIAMPLSQISFTLTEKENPLCSVPGYSFYQKRLLGGYIFSACREGDETFQVTFQPVF